MTDRERAQVLKLIEEGRITPEEGLRLLQALEQNPAEDEVRPSEPAAAPHPEQDPGQAESGARPGPFPDPAVQRGVEITRRLWLFIPLATGTLVTVLGGWIMYANMHPSSFNAWFYCLGLPVVLVGVALMACGSASQTARWIYLRVEQKPGERPRHIALGFPLPLGLAAWILRNFGHYIPNMDQFTVDEVFVALGQTTSSDSPLVVNVDEGAGGDRVQVYLG
ncbi:MAG: hypothetical protein ABSB41_11420 [Anaerolineales bacterium]